MNKEQFFLAAMAADEYKRRAWVISAFSLIREGPDDWKKSPYPYRIVQTTTGFFFVDPNKENQLTQIEGGKVGEPLFRFKDRIKLAKGQIPNLDRSVDTTYGNLLFNYITLIYPFGHKVAYLEGRISPSQIENIILPRLRDTPPEGEARDDQFLYVDEYLKFADAMFALVGYTQLCVPAATEKTMQPAPGIFEYRKKLLEENKDSLNDPATIAKIDAALVAYDKESFKGDLAEGFLISGKSFNVVRKAQYGMQGALTTLGDASKPAVVTTSLSEGWDMTKFPELNTALRAGSYLRGAETQLGGALVKELQRASANLRVVEEDCRTQLGVEIDVTPENYKQLVGFHLVGKTLPIPVPDEEEAKKYIGKTVMRRSPMFCKAKLTDRCQYCVGAQLAANPTALSVAVSEYGSVIMLLSMKAMHGKALSIKRLEWKKLIT